MSSLWRHATEDLLLSKGADPNRIYKAAEIKELKESGKRSEEVPPVIRKIHKRGTEADPLLELFAATVEGRATVVEYEPDIDLRDTEQIPLQEGGLKAFLRREVLPYAADAWYQAHSLKVGYEISFTRYFYEPMRTLAEIRTDILALEHETEGLLAEILGTIEQWETDCMTEIIFEITEDERGGRRVLGERARARHSHPGNSIEEIRTNVKAAIDCYFDDTMERPKLIRLHFVRDEVLVA